MSGLAGRLTELVTLQRPDAERDALGGWTGLWDTLGQCRAELAPDGAGRVTAGRWVATVRTPNEAAAGDRLLWAGRKLLVRHVWHDPRRPDRIEIFCEEAK